MPDRARAALLLAFLALLVAFAFQGSHGLFDPSEGRYAEVAREMVASHNFLEPTLDGQPHFTKPPLAYWVASAGLELFGRNAWGARFSIAIAFFFTVLAVAAIAARLWGRRAGFVAGLVYLSSLFPVVSAAFLTTDTLLTMWEVLAVLMFVMFWQSAVHSSGSHRGSRLWVRGMWLCFGMGFATKGPPALLPLLAIVVFAFGLRFRRRLFDPVGIVLFLFAAFWWYLVVSLRNPGLATYFIRDEIIGRNFTEQFHRNTQWYAPFIFYLPPLGVGSGLWMVEAVRGIHAAATTRSGPPWGARDSTHRFLVLWAVLPLIVLSLSKSRLPLYVLPFFAPVSLMVAAAAARAGRRRLVVLGVVSIVLCVAAKGAIPMVNQKHNAQMVYEAAIAAGGPDARYVFLDERRLYGVQFYFDGKIERISTNGDQPWARRDLPSVLDEVESRGERLVFITHRAGAATIERAVSGGELRSVRTHFRDKEIVTVEAGP